MDTAPLPVVAADPEPPPRARGALRVLEMLAGLASAGLVVVGLGLVALQIAAPELFPGTGSAAAVGPTWWRALVQLGTGLAGEAIVWARPRMSRAARVWAAMAQLAVVGAVLWLCWWA